MVQEYINAQIAALDEAIASLTKAKEALLEASGAAPALEPAEEPAEPSQQNPPKRGGWKKKLGNKRWTEADDLALIRGLEKGRTRQEIADYLGRTEESIKKHVRELRTAGRLPETIKF